MWAGERRLGRPWRIALSRLFTLAGKRVACLAMSLLRAICVPGWNVYEEDAKSVGQWWTHGLPRRKNASTIPWH